MSRRFIGSGRFGFGLGRAHGRSRPGHRRFCRWAFFHRGLFLDRCHLGFGGFCRRFLSNCFLSHCFLSCGFFSCCFLGYLFLLFVFFLCFFFCLWFFFCFFFGYFCFVYFVC